LNYHELAPLRHDSGHEGWGLAHLQKFNDFYFSSGPSISDGFSPRLFQGCSWGGPLGAGFWGHSYLHGGCVVL